MAILKKDVSSLVPVLAEPQTVSVPELGGEVIVRPLMLSERIAIAQEARKKKPRDFGFIALLLAYAVVDGDGEQLFTTAEWQAWGRSEKNMNAAIALWDIAFSMSGLDAEQAEKNSKAQSSS